MLSNGLHQIEKLPLFKKIDIWIFNKKPCPKKLRTPFKVVSGNNVCIAENFTLSTSNPFDYILCPSTIPSIIMKKTFPCICEELRIDFVNIV